MSQLSTLIKGKGSKQMGRITVLDRQGLEKRTCECYAVVKREYDRLLPSKEAT